MPLVACLCHKQLQHKIVWLEQTDWNLMCWVFQVRCWEIQSNGSSVPKAAISHEQPVSSVLSAVLFWKISCHCGVGSLKLFTYSVIAVWWVCRCYARSGRMMEAQCFQVDVTSKSRCGPFHRVASQWPLESMMHLLKRFLGSQKWTFWLQGAGTRLSSKAFSTQLCSCWIKVSLI